MPAEPAEGTAPRRPRSLAIVRRNTRPRAHGWRIFREPSVGAQAHRARRREGAQNAGSGAGRRAIMCAPARDYVRPSRTQRERVVTARSVRTFW